MEGRRKHDEELGYVMASIIHNNVQIDKIVEMIDRNAHEDRERASDIAAQLQEMRDELNMYKTVLTIVKALGWTAAFVLAFKFGDIPDLWKD